MLKLFSCFALLLVIGCTGSAIDYPQVQIHQNAEKTPEGLLPIITIQPRYPRNALRHGIYNGSVLVEYDVLPNGSVVNPRVIEEQPSGYFAKAAVESTLKFKYTPSDFGYNSVRSNVTFQLRN